ncbi:MAG: hypothetical protein IPK26_28765 [Planctomycetes bacterium]|nr:hypothetical protein [Planctomycetota bacterium]
MQQDPGGLARLFQQARATPIAELHDDRERVLAWHRDLLQQLDLDLAGAEAAWQRHVLTTYPRR